MTGEPEQKPGLTWAPGPGVGSRGLPRSPGQLPHTLLPAVSPLPIPENIGKAQVLRVHSSQNPEEKAAKAEG